MKNEQEKETIELIKKRANQKCEYCGNETFKNNHNKNYLEVHHINFLCEGGEDELYNLIALCPNCHRKAHFSKEKEYFKEKILNKAKIFKL